ncbi:MAG: VWA domain-containing protein, partial [Planctomycetota bacterium]
RAAGREVRVISPAAFPPDLLALEDHALIVLDNVAIDTLPFGTADRLDAYARSFGGGIIFIGGTRALTAGGWRGSGIEDALPVRLEIPDRIVMPETAVVFVLDRSGSMRNSVLGSSKSQQEVANAAAAAAIDTLDPSDLVGVISFSNSASVVVPVSPNDDPIATRDAVLGIRSEGGTNLPAALEAAGRELRGVQSKSKHVIVLSDGESRDSELLPGLATDLSAEGVRVTTIAVGDGADVTTLRTVAERGGGVLYRVTNPNTLPQVFIKAVRVLREPAVRSTPFAPITVDPDAAVLAGVGPIPQLGGIVLTSRRERATTPVVTPEDEPIIAYWPVELGRIAVVATDAHEWSADWAAAQSFARFWTNITAWTARAVEDTPGELRIAPSGDAADFVYEARDDAGAPLDGMDVSVSLYAPDGSERRVDLTQTGPGRYEGRAGDLPEGVLVAATRATSDGRPIAPSVAGVQVRTNAEDLALSSDEAGLAALAARTGGRVIDWEQPQPLFAREGPPRIVRSALWPNLLIVAMVLYLLDVGMRRVAWDRWVSSAREGTVAATAERVSTLDQLKRGPRVEQPAVETSAAAERQRIERERVQRQMAEARQRAVGRATPEVKESASPKPEPETEESGLLAAKRRARKRFEES